MNLTGGVNAAFIAVDATAGFDSWLTVGITGGDTGGKLSSIGVDWSAWTPHSPMDNANGAVFWCACTCWINPARWLHALALGHWLKWFRACCAERARIEYEVLKYGVTDLRTFCLCGPYRMAPDDGPSGSVVIGQVTVHATVASPIFQPHTMFSLLIDATQFATG